jgi:hypothetical protein
MQANPAPQLTLKAVILSVILTVILASANAYVGLFAGLTVATAIPAAVISMAVLPLLGGSSILENNIVATGASAGSSIAAGAIFTLPALILLHHWTSFEYWWTLSIVGLGGLLGVLFSVPLRRTLIIEQKLLFPEGVAAAEVLKVGADPGIGAKYLSAAAIAAGAFKLVTSGLRLLPETFTVKGFVGERGIAFFGYSFSPALLGVGYIVGLNVAVLIAAGGLFSWWLAIPIYNSFFFDHDPALLQKLSGLDPEDAAFAIWRAQVRYIGVGCMLTGALWALWSLRRSLWSAVRSGLAAGGLHAADVPHTERDLPMGAVLIGIALFVVPLFLLYYAVVGSIGVSLAMAVIMIVAGFLFSSVSGYMAGLVGSSNNPVSGITICTIQHRRRRGGVHRRGGVQRRRGGRRQSAGLEGRAAGGSDALAPAGHAGDRRAGERRRHGARDERAVVRIRHRRAGSSRRQGAAGAAGEPGEIRRRRHVRRHAANRHDRHRRPGGRADHRARPVFEAPRIALERSGARGRRRHLSAARRVDPHSGGRHRRRIRRPVACAAQRRPGSGEAQTKRHAVRRRHDHRRGAGRHFHRHVHLGEREFRCAGGGRGNAWRKMGCGGVAAGDLLLDVPRRHPAPHRLEGRPRRRSECATPAVPRS